MRELNISQYNTIQWDRIYEGINIVIHRINKKEEFEEVIEQNRFHQWIEDEIRNKFQAEELEAYDMIARFIDEGGICFEQNRQKYLNSMSEGSIRTVALLADKRFDRFDKELAEATEKCYAFCSQPDRNTFPHYFTGIWGSLDREKYFRREKTVEGLRELKKRLEMLKKKYEVDEKKWLLKAWRYLLRKWKDSRINTIQM